MKQKKLLTLTFSQLKQIFNQELPELVEIAEKSTTVEDFKAELLTFSETCDIKSDTAKEARAGMTVTIKWNGISWTGNTKSHTREKSRARPRTTY